MTDKYADECSKAAYLDVNLCVCDVLIIHTMIHPEVSISLTKLPFKRTFYIKEGRLYIACNDKKAFFTSADHYRGRLIVSLG